MLRGRPFAYLLSLVGRSQITAERYYHNFIVENTLFQDELEYQRSELAEEFNAISSLFARNSAGNQMELWTIEAIENFLEKVHLFIQKIQEYLIEQQELLNIQIEEML